jgi:hypothetical protein
MGDQQQAAATATFPRADYHDNGFCLGCGYALRGLSDSRCPECGRTFDPFNSRTMRVPGLSQKPPPKPVAFGVAMIIYAVITSLASLVGLMDPAAGVCVMAAIAWAIIFGAWWGRNRWERRARTNGDTLPKQPRGARHWRAIVIVLFIGCAISGIGWSRCPHGRYYRYGPVALFRSSGLASGGAGGGGPCRNVMTGDAMRLSENWYFIGP